MCKLYLNKKVSNGRDQKWFQTRAVPETERAKCGRRRVSRHEKRARQKREVDLRPQVLGRWRGRAMGRARKESGQKREQQPLLLACLAGSGGMA